MIRLKAIMRNLISFGIALVIFMGSIYYGVGVTEVFAAAINTPTIRMGDNDPMTRSEFLAWRDQKGFRHINIEGRIYPAGIFFDWANGSTFDYGTLSGGVLYVALRSSTITDNNSAANNNPPSANGNDAQNPQESDYPVPFIFADLTPVLLSYDELTELIESVPHQNPMDVRSDITLPNRRLTEYELAAWVDEYIEMGGVTAFELAVVREINRVREYYGVRPLALDPVLMMSARLKTQEFGDLQYFSHTSPVHGSPSAMADLLGFEGLGVSETITRAGSNRREPVFRTTPEGIVQGMLLSTRGHRAILLNPNIYSVGFGAFFSPNSTGPNGNTTHMFYFATKFGFYA